MALRAAYGCTELIKALAPVIKEPHDAVEIKYCQIDLLRQRVYELASDFEVLNHHNWLRCECAKMP